MNTKNFDKETLHETEEELQDPTPSKIPLEDRIRIFANIIVDRILELEKNNGTLPLEIKIK